MTARSSQTRGSQLRSLLAFTLAVGSGSVILVGFVVTWELVAARPVAAVRLTLLAVAASCMGIQGAAVNRLDLPGFGTTFLTSTLIRGVTGLVTGRRQGVLQEFSAVAAAAAGALVGATLVLIDRRFAPFVALGLLAGVIVTATRVRRAGGRLARERALDDPRIGYLGDPRVGRAHGRPGA